MIPAETLTAIADAAATLPVLDDAGLAQLRAAWPGLHLTLCSDNDVPARVPAMHERPGFNLYLVNGGGVVSASALTTPAPPLRGGREHCLTLTNDPEVAIGVVLAWVDEE
jgi:hypothetical protein